MATSLINTECKRYGCRKNLLACYANCRYNTRCDELRGEVTDNLEQATKDINTYRLEHGQNLIEIQMPKRGLKFAEVAGNTPAPVAKKRGPSKERAMFPRQTLKKLEDGGQEPQSSKPAIKRKRKKRRNRPRVTKPQAGMTQALPRVETAAAQRTTHAPALKPLKVRQTKSTTETRIKMPKKTRAEVTETTSHEDRLFAPTAEATHLVQPDVKIATQGRKGSKSTTAKKPKKQYIIIEGERGTLVGEQGLLNRILAGVSPGARYFEATELEVRLQISPKK